jgi:protein SCO1/2
LPSRWASAATLVVVAILASSTHAPPVRGQSQSTPPAPGTILKGVGFDQNLGRQIPLDIPFVDEQGRVRTLGEYFGKRPVILSLVYFRCPMLCGQTLVSLTRTLRALPTSPGDGFDVLTVSFDPEEASELAAAKKKTTLDYLGRARADRGWHFLTGTSESIERLTRSVGFQYKYNPISKQYAHAAGLVILSPDGLITRYFFGVDYPPKELETTLDQAAAREVGSPIARLLMLCYDYDPATGKYTLAIVRVLQVLGAGTALALGAYVVSQLVREARQKHLGAGGTDSDAAYAGAATGGR